jgi:hypothetical protein
MERGWGTRSPTEVASLYGHHGPWNGLASRSFASAVAMLSYVAVRLVVRFPITARSRPAPSQVFFVRQASQSRSSLRNSEPASS